MKSHMPCLALSLVFPSGSCAEPQMEKGGEARDPTRMEPFLMALEGSVFPRDAIPVSDGPAL